MKRFYEVTRVVKTYITAESEEEALEKFEEEDFVIEDGERIAQMVIAHYEQAEWLEVDVLDETERGEGGFGHTGKK